MKKRNLKHLSYIGLCFLLGYGYFHTQNQTEIQKEVTVVDYQDYRQVVYIDKDGILIPISYTIEDCPTIQSEAMVLFSLMKNPGSLENELFSIVPQNTQLESVVLENDILQLHFNELNGLKELRFLEATAYVFTQLEGVSGIEYYLNGEKLNQLPNGQIQLNEPMTSQLGMNNFEAGTDHLYDTKAVTVYYSKNVNKEECYVPVSKRIDKSSTLDEELSSIIGEISISSTLNQASLLDGVTLLDGSYLEEGHLYVNLNDAVLFDETTINQDVYDLLLLSFSELDGVNEVTILVEGEPLETRETISVADIVYNIAKI